jgi:tRNA (adenine57-N1/adenine58-N1)-methyltransferase
MEVEKEKEKEKEKDNEKEKTIENNENENNSNIIKEENTIENNKTINYGDLIVVYENGDSVKYFTLEKGKKLNNKYGTFSHDDIYGKNYGCKIYNKDNTKYIYILSFVPNIWERCINKMTQILFNPDISLIMVLLNLSQSSIIYESGTGSGCLSVNMSSMLSKGKGHLYTFEFNKERADKLKDLFKLLKLDNKITVTHRDVIQDGFELDEKELENKSHKKCGSMFIDLPSPWLVIKHAKKVLLSGAYFVSFSPCIEQINQTMKAMKENNFIELRMFECLYRTFSYARTTQIKVPIINKKRKKGEEIQFQEVNIDVTKNKCDMRGHTGFLLFGINKD